MFSKTVGCTITSLRFVVTSHVAIQALPGTADLAAEIAYVALRDWSKSIGGGGGWAGAFGNVVDKKHMTHPLPLAQK